MIPIVAWTGASYVSKTLEDEATKPVEALTVEIGLRETDARQSVDVEVAFGIPKSLQMEGEGLVTEVALTPGKTISTGEKVLSIDGSPKFAYTTGMPFYRDLEPGNEGADVASLISFLRELQLLPADSPDDYFTYEASSALTSFQASVGLKADGLLRKGDFIYVPSDFGDVTEVIAVVGASLPSDGAIAVGEGAVDAVKVVEAGGDSVPSGYREDDEIVLLADENETHLGSFYLQGPAATEVAKSLDDWAAAGIVAVERDENLARYSRAFTALSVPLEMGVVPNTALLGGVEGATCILVVRDGLADPQVVTVQTRSVPGEIGVAGLDIEHVGLEIIRDVSTEAWAASECQ